MARFILGNMTEIYSLAALFAWAFFLFKIKRLAESAGKRGQIEGK